MIRFPHAPRIPTFITLTSILVAATGGCADDNVVFKCSVTCAGIPVALKDEGKACESRDKSGDDVARLVKQGAGDAGAECNASCQKTDEACTQK
jgi:hypothetical protein